MEYQHGGDIYSQKIRLDYSANINPFGMPEEVRDELVRCLDSDVCSVYPDSRCRKLRSALGLHHSLQEQWIICGNGAADLIFGLTAAIKPGHGLVTAPSFSEYQQALAAAGCRTDHFILREEEGFVPDIGEMCGCILKADRQGDAYDIVFLCNPNNPTGIPVEREGVEELAKTCLRTGALLVADECFCDFLDIPQAYSVIPSLCRFENLFVLKAFTKLYAMAGLRLGYGLCSNESLLERLEAARQPWSVSGLAQRAGVAALGAQAYVETTRRVLGHEREWLGGALSGMGFNVYPSRANYLFFRDNEEEARQERGWKMEDGTGCRKNWGKKWEKGWLYHQLLEQQVLIRSCANYPGLDSSYYRICVRLREENRQLVRQMRLVLERDTPLGS